MKIIYSVLLNCIAITGMSQLPYTLNDKINDIPIAKIINTKNPSGTLKDRLAQLTILDFFGTWCVPCVKALPALINIQETYKDKISILLISNEQEDRLTNFVNKRTPFPFPIVVDEQNKFTQLFSPPSYPYTVILDQTGTIIAITDAAAINEKMIDEWLAGKRDSVQQIKSINEIDIASANLQSSNKLVQLSQEFMYAAKTGENTEKHSNSLKSLDYSVLKNELETDDEKKAFWINLYNGFTQALLKKDPASYKKRSKFFTEKQIEIAGKSFSLDDIEHGILRRSKLKWSLGHISKLFPNKTEKELRVHVLDNRIHFALNCGAKSCPPIAFYKPENINPQLELATNAYLTGEAEYNAGKNTIALPALMSWFRRDFGGKKKMILLLKEKKLIPVDANPRIIFKKYDWTLYTGNYIN